MILINFNQDVSPNFRFNYYDSKVAKKLIELEATPQAIEYFSKVCNELTDYSYWFLLSTLWVSYTGFSDLNLWKRLFSSDRPKQKKSIMKPTEVKSYDQLPWFIKAYRVHRPNETDWIAYTLNVHTALRFAKERGVKSISEYKIKKRDVTALFKRRGESEIILLDKEKAEFIREIEIVYTEPQRSDDQWQEN